MPLLSIPVARIAAILSLSLLVACGGTASSDGPAEHEDGEAVTIYRDSHGTPHVVADSNRGVFYGYGYAVATDRLFQMEMLRRTTQGRVAEVLGPDFVDLDRQLRTAYDHRSVHRQLAALPARQRAVLKAYAEGFNRRVDEVLARPDELLPVEFGDFDFQPSQWSDYDVAMAFVGSIAHRYSDFNSERDNLALLQYLEQRHGKADAWRIFNASKWLLDTDSPTTVPRPETSPHTAPLRPDYLDQLPPAAPEPRLVLDERGRFAGLSRGESLRARYRERLARDGFGHHPQFAAASNYWAVRGLADARAALVNGPQFGFSTPSYVYGIGLHGGDFDAVGNTLLALPCLLFAHNNRIAWGSTAGMSDQSDEFALALDPENPERYRHDGQWRELESWPEVIEVRGGETVMVTARRSAQGMVQHHDPGRSVAWVRARAWEGQELATLMAWIFLATDQSLEAAQQRIGAMASNINMYTMDREGNLGYVHSGRYPQRAAGHDPRLPVPGAGQWDWQGLRPYADNPRVSNPERAYIANWNNRPSADWPSSDLWTYTWGRADRARLLFDELEAVRGGSVAELRDINRRIAFADVNAPFLLPYLEDAWRGVETPAREQRALDLLSDWQRQWQVDEAGNFGPAAALMEAWLRTLLVAVFADDIGDTWFHLYAATNYPHRPAGASISNPPGAKALLRNLDRLRENGELSWDFFNGEPADEVLRRSFREAVEELEASQGSAPGDWHLAAHPMQWTPYNFRGVPQARIASQAELPVYMNRGSENNLFVATGEGIVAWDAIPPGQSGFINPRGEPGEHTRDQLGLYAGFGYKSVPFTREQVQSAAASEQVLHMSR